MYKVILSIKFMDHVLKYAKIQCLINNRDIGN